MERDGRTMKHLPEFKWYMLTEQVGELYFYANKNYIYYRTRSCHSLGVELSIQGRIPAISKNHRIDTRIGQRTADQKRKGENPS